MSEIVYLNGRLIPRDAAMVSVHDGGWLHGAGLFETMRAHHGTIFRLDAHLDRLTGNIGATRLPDLTADTLERHLSLLRDDGLSVRSLNFARQIAVAFLSWCVKTGRAESNPLSTTSTKTVPVPCLGERPLVSVSNTTDTRISW